MIQGRVGRIEPTCLPRSHPVPSLSQSTFLRRSKVHFGSGNVHVISDVALQIELETGYPEGVSDSPLAAPNIGSFG